MLEPLLGSVNRERVLLYLFGRKEGYAREMALFFKTDLSQIQKQLERMEQGGVLFCRKVGKTRLYGLNPRYPFISELNALLEKTISFLPEKESESLLMVRTRPRRNGKPI